MSGGGFFGRWPRSFHVVVINELHVDVVVVVVVVVCLLALLEVNHSTTPSMFIQIIEIILSQACDLFRQVLTNGYEEGVIFSSASSISSN